MAEQSDDTAKGWSRRDLLGGAALLAMALGIPTAAVTLSDAGDDDAPSKEQVSLMKDVAQRVLPATQTKGAGDVGVGAFVLLALAHGLENARAPLAKDSPSALRAFKRRDGSLNHAAYLQAELNRRVGSEYLSATDDKRTAALAALDAKAFAKGQDAHPWRTVKALILLGYYTSEEGGSRELAYEHVPGRWVPDMPMTPDARSYSSDWTGVEFG